MAASARRAGVVEDYILADVLLDLVRTAYLLRLLSVHS